MLIWARTSALSALIGAPFLIACGSAVSAQADDHAVASTGRQSCLDSIPASALSRVGVYGAVEFADSVSKGPRFSAENLLQDVAFRIQALLGASPNTIPVGEPDVTWRGLGAPLFVTVHRDGRITHRVSRTRSDTVAAALLAKALDSPLSQVPPFEWGADSLRDSVSFRFDLGWATVDSAGKVQPARFTRTPVALFSVAHPWEMSVTPSRRNRGPSYPPGPRNSWVEGYVNMQFLVDTSGHAVPASMRAVWPASIPELTGEKRRYYDAFVDEIRRALPKMEFSPALIGGCKTAQLVQMPFEFKLNR
jgi:hypothetical protein